MDKNSPNTDFLADLAPFPLLAKALDTFRRVGAVNTEGVFERGLGYLLAGLPEKLREAGRMTRQRSTCALSRHDAVLACIDAGRPIRDADLALHVAFVEETNNPRFAEFLRMHGVSAIPQAEIVTDSKQDRQLVHYHQLHGEHEKIVLAISNRDEDAAREAMRAHLKGSQIRHRELLRSGRLRQPGSNFLTRRH